MYYREWQRERGEESKRERKRAKRVRNIVRLRARERAPKTSHSCTILVLTHVPDVVWNGRESSARLIPDIVCVDINS